MIGELTIYNKNKRLSLFETNPSLPNKFIFIGGLTDGLLALPYLDYLSKVLINFNYSLIQPILSSSYLGYGRVNLDTDIEELDDIISYLVNKNNINNENLKSHKIILMGHSTGAQDAMHYIKNGINKKFLSGIILQGAVSDREYAVFSKGESALKKEIAIARDLVNQGKGKYYMPPEVDDAPITAERFLSLNDTLGKDDMFSSDLSNIELGKVFLDLDFKEGNHRKYISCPIFLISSGGDEYVPDAVDILKHTQRMQDIAILKGWTRDGYDKNKITTQSNKNISNYSINIFNKLSLNNVFINTESAIEVAAVIPKAKHAIEEVVEQDQLMEVIQLLLKKLDNDK